MFRQVLLIFYMLMFRQVLLIFYMLMFRQVLLIFYMLMFRQVFIRLIKPDETSTYKSNVVMAIATQFTCLLMTWWRFSIRNRGTPRLEICSLIVYTVCM
jgi:hypothetical protein